MAIRFDENLNSEMRRVVRNFNQKRNRAIKRGYHFIPQPLSVSELKQRYTTRSELVRDLNRISQFNKGKDAALKAVETSGGAKAIKWEYDYLKANLKYAQSFYDRQIENASKMDTELNVSKMEYVNNLKTKRQFLELEFTDLNQSQFNTMRATINEALNANARNLASYRGWLNEVETIMRHLGYSNKEINSLFEGLDELTPEQFIKMYRQNALVSRIYELYIPSRDRGDFKLSTTEEDARELLDTFLAEKRDMIEKAKQD